MQFRTEAGMKLLLDLWEGRQSAVLSFNEIKKELGWGSSKAAHQIKLAVSAGYLEKTGTGKQEGYRNRMADYSGYFNGFEYLAEIDQHCRKSGKVQSIDHPLRMLTPLHVVEYGVPKEEDLTPLESELLFTIRARLAHAFEDYSNLCGDIEYRQKIEGFKKLPDSVRGPLFARDNKEDKGKPAVSIKAAQAIYGDVLWEHIFQWMMNDIRERFVRGTLDATGPVELVHSYRPLMETASAMAKVIREGKASHYNDPDSATTVRLRKLQDERDMQRITHLGEREPPDVAVVVTHSPRTMGGYSYQIGTIVRDEYDYWSEDKPTFASVIAKAKSRWGDKVKDVSGVKTRREAFIQGLVAEICLMRAEREQPISETDHKFMLRDARLREVLTEEQVSEVVTKVRNIVDRAKKFRVEIAKGAEPAKLVNNPDWFTQEEMDQYAFLDHFIPPAYNAPKGGTPPDLKGFNGSLDSLFDDLDRKWPSWNLKERRRRSKDRNRLMFGLTPGDKGGKSG